MAVCDIHSVWAVLLVILNKVEVCPLFAALRVFCHTQHIRNMHATWRVARPRNAVIYDCFALLPLTGCKKGRTSFKRLAVPKMRGKSAKHRKLQRCVARNTPCCVHVAYVLRMTKPTQRCEGCKKLKCLRTLSHFPWSTLNRRQNAATAVFTCIVAQHLFFLRGWQLGSSHSFGPIYVNPISFAFGANATILINRSLGCAQEEKND